MGPALPDADHVARYCKPSTFIDDELTLAAFLLRPSESYLSVNWLESLNGADQAARLATLKVEIANAGYQVAKSGKYAILNVGTTRQMVHERSPDQRWIRVTQETAGFPFYHAGIHDTATDEMLVAQAILDSIVTLESAK